MLAPRPFGLAAALASLSCLLCSTSFAKGDDVASLPNNAYPGFKKAGPVARGEATEYSDTTQLKLPMPKLKNGCFKVVVAVDSKDELVGQVDQGGSREKIYSTSTPGVMTMSNEICGDEFGTAPIEIIIRRTSGTGEAKLRFSAEAQVYVQPRSSGKRAAQQHAIVKRGEAAQKRSRADACRACRLEPDSCLIRRGLTRGDCN